MERIRQKIGNIKLYLSYIEHLNKDYDKKINHDVVYRGALLYYLYLMADTCISLAEMVIKYRDLRPPQSYSDAFDVLGEHEILEKEFAYSLINNYLKSRIFFQPYKQGEI